jgi:hypothetical protein
LQREGFANERDKKHKWLKDVEQMIQFRDFLKDKEKEKQLQDHERYVKGCEETNRKRGD